jgi:hypothetical protein
VTPLERLYAEAIPTGTFGDAPAPRPASRIRRPISATEAAQHRADLLAALDEHEADRKPVRYLRPVPPIREAS